MRGVVLMSRTLAAGLGSILASMACAQEVDVTALQLKACGLIKDDAARVRCYDRAVGRPESAPSLVPVSPSPGGALVAIPAAPPVAGPQLPAPAGPQAPMVVPPPAATIPPAAAPVAPQAPAVTAAAPPAPAAPTVGPAPPPKTEDDGWFGLRSAVRAITPPGFGGAASSTESDAPRWQVKADNAALQDASRLLATLESPDEKAVLVLQCQNARTEAHVTIPRFLGWEGMRVRYRVSDDPPSESVWAAAADGRGAVASDAVGFINSLVDGGTLVLRLTDYEGTDHDLRFSLGSVSGLRSQIATVCRWPSAAPATPPAYEPAPPGPREAKSKSTRPPTVGAPLPLH